MLLTINDYWMGRDSKYRDEMTELIQSNAAETVRRLNLLLLAYEEDTGLPLPMKDGSHVASGWRPLAVNDATSNAAAHSKHITGQGGDIYDPERDLARWVMAHQAILEQIGLWCEDFGWTPTWVHGQTVPPGSGKRIYIPSTNPPLAEALT